MSACVNVYWLEQAQSDMPADNGWLSAAEVLRLDGMRFAKRRADWRLGRWTAKCAVTAYLGLRGYFRSIELRAAPCGAPEAYHKGRPAPLSLSLSHRDGTAVCVVAPRGTELGCDLERIEPHSDNFLEDYFTPEEQALVAKASPAQRFPLLALLWSAKESALKALRVGLRLDTRSVAVSPLDSPAVVPGQWQQLRVSCSDGRMFHGWWGQRDGLVRTLVAAPSSAAPIVLKVAA